MPDMLSISVRGIDQLKKFFIELPVEVRKIAVHEAAEYILGDDTHGLRHLVKWKKVTRKQAYGQSFQSDKQRRWFFAALADGSLKVPYTRTGATAAGWHAVQSGGGFGAKLQNSTKGAYYSQGDYSQTRLNALIGHRKMTDVISTNIQGAMRAASQAIQRWINGKGY